MPAVSRPSEASFSCCASAFELGVGEGGLQVAVAGDHLGEGSLLEVRLNGVHRGPFDATSARTCTHLARLEGTSAGDVADLVGSSLHDVGILAGHVAELLVGVPLGCGLDLRGVRLRGLAGLALRHEAHDARDDPKTHRDGAECATDGPEEGT